MREDIKPMDILWNDAGGVDLLIERDLGNPVLILFGKPEYALPAWIRLLKLCTRAISAIEKEQGL